MDGVWSDVILGIWLDDGVVKGMRARMALVLRGVALRGC